jgi:alpha-D-ribose 1-methylphosphonate 5-triphosphate synthase subunit PhnG
VSLSSVTNWEHADHQTEQDERSDSSEIAAALVDGGLFELVDGGLFDRTRRSEILCLVDADRLVEWVDALVPTDVDVSIVRPPEVGLVMMQVREPVAHDHFYLGEILVTRTEVVINNHPGWSMRMGDDRPGALACALLDAWSTTSIDAANAIDTRCAEVLAVSWQAEIEEWERLRKTEVRFDELESDRNTASSVTTSESLSPHELAKNPSDALSRAAQ